MTRVGALRYLNALPLIDGLEQEPAIGSVRYEIPSLLARDLRSGSLDLALVPQVEACHDPDYRLVPGICIACDGPVESILLFLRNGLKDWRDARRIGADVSSNTSVELLRVLMHRTGIEADLCPVEPRLDSLRSGELDAVLLIADPALAADRGEFARVDLGDMWKQETGLPFVFAVWLGREAAPAAARQAIQRTAERGLARRSELARSFCREYPAIQEPADAERYIREVIRYRLEARELESLELFHGLRRAAGFIPDQPWRPRFYEVTS